MFNRYQYVKKKSIPMFVNLISEIDYLVACDEKLKRVEKYLVRKTFKQVTARLNHKVF